MAGFGEHKKDFRELGVNIIAASVDPQDKAEIVADEAGLRVAFGVTREQADLLDSWWEERRGIIQPSEFLLDSDGTVLASSYSSGPIGRIDAADIVAMVKHRESQK